MDSERIEKKCGTCKLLKPINDFGNCKKAKDGKSYRCKKCMCEKTKIYYKKNIDYVRNYYAKKTPEQKNKLKIYAREYRKKYPEKIIETRKKSSLKNSEKIKQRNNSQEAKLRKLKWKKQNPEKVAQDRAKRRALEKKAYPKWAQTNFSKQIKQFYLDSNYLKNLTKAEFHVDHIIPLVNKFVCGLHVPWNLQILTAQENYNKNNKLNNGD